MSDSREQFEAFIVKQNDEADISFGCPLKRDVQGGYVLPFVSAGWEYREAPRRYLHEASK